MSLNIVNGFTGQFSIGHAGFMARRRLRRGRRHLLRRRSALWRLGRHPRRVPRRRRRRSIVGACVVGGLVAALVGYVVGLPSLRLRGDYLAIVTLGFGEIVRVLLQRTDDVVLDAEEIARRASLAAARPHLGGALGFSPACPYYTTLFWTSGCS